MVLYDLCVLSDDGHVGVVLFQERFSQDIGGSSDQITTLQSQVEEVKGVMTQNIERVLERGQRLEELMDKTTDLEANVSQIQSWSMKPN